MTPTQLISKFSSTPLVELRAWAKKQGVENLAMYGIYLHFFKRPECACGQSTRWDNGRRSFREFCSIKCRNSSSEIVKRRNKTCLARFGNSNPNATPEVKEKKRLTFLKTYGVDNPSKAQAVKEKKRRTFQKHYGADHWAKVKPTVFVTNNPMHNPKSKAKQQRTNIERYGHSNPMHSFEVQKKLRNTFLQNYGVDNPRKSPQVKAKVTAAYQAYIKDPANRREFVARILAAKSSGYNYYTAVDQFGIEHKVQGYERFVVTKFKPTQVKKVSTKTPLIPYGSRLYSPDLVITMNDGSKRIVEVKSMFTLCHGLDTNIAKFKAAEKFCKEYENVSFWLIVCDAKQNVKIYSNPASFALRCRAQGLNIVPRSIRSV